MNIHNNPGTATDPIAAIVTDFNLKTPGSKRAAAYNRDFLSDKSSIGLPFTMQTKEALYPIVASHAEGAYLQDVDNNRYVDILMGLGTNLFGHNPSFIRTAIEAQLAKGFALGPQSDLAGETAELFCRITGKDRVTFSNTGTEAVQTAMRIARAATGATRSCCLQARIMAIPTLPCIRRPNLNISAGALCCGLIRHGWWR